MGRRTPTIGLIALAKNTVVSQCGNHYLATHLLKSLIFVLKKQLFTYTPPLLLNANYKMRDKFRKVIDHRTIK